MDFELSSDQQMLRDSAHRYLQDAYPYERHRCIVREGGYSAQVWRDFAQFGWLGATLPEASGGYGGPVEAAILMEAFGRHRVVEPFVWTIVMGGQLLRHGALSGRRETLIQRLIEGQLHLAWAVPEGDAGQDFNRIESKATPLGAGWKLEGRKAVVCNGGVADMAFVTARLQDGIGLFLLDAGMPGLAWRRFQCNDGSAAAELTLHGVEVGRDSLIASGPDAIDLLDLASDHGCAALCAEVVGSCAYLVQTTSEYLKTREQYGAPLARFQVLQHRLADMYVAVELARSMAWVAACALEHPVGQRRRDVSSARVQAIRCARLVGREAVQLHGGMGMSEELDVSAHFKRLMLSTLLLGDETHHLRRMGAQDGR